MEWEIGQSTHIPSSPRSYRTLIELTLHTYKQKTHVCMYVYVCMYVCMSVRMYVCIVVISSLLSDIDWAPSGAATLGHTDTL